MENGTVTMTLGEVDTLARRVLTQHGLRGDHVDAVARTIVAGERDGSASHGVYRLLVAVNTLRTGKVDPVIEPVITRPAPALVKADAGGAFAQLAIERALPVLVDSARTNGIAALAVNHCIHFAALWPEVEMVVAEGLVALATTPSHAWVAPAGGHRPLLGTNPIAFGWPRPGGTPFVFDFATSAAARGEIELHRRAGKPIPAGWGLDADGQPTTDAQAALDGAMLTWGGHKGSALSIMVELIAGPLIGDLTSAESMAWDAGAGASPYGGELIVAIDPAGFLGPGAAEHLARAETLFGAMAAQGARLPGARRHANRAVSMEEGVRIPSALHRDILALLDTAG